MRFNPIKLLEGLLYTAPALLLTLAACGGGGGGGGSTTIVPVVAPTVAPVASAPTSGCYAVNLNWNAVAGATGYNVYGAASSVGVISASNKLTATPDTTTSYTDTSATSSPRYYQITAVNSGGEGPGSNVVNGTTKGTCTKVGGSIQGNSLNLSTAVSTMEGTAGYQGLVNGAGAGVQFSSPRGVTTDGTNLYVADTSNNVIRKIVISTGVVTTLAGTGASGSADGAYNFATFSAPQGITTDGTSIYVADTNNGSIRKIDTSGNVTTLGTPGAFALPAAITYGGSTNLYIADTNNSSIKLVDSVTGAVSGAFTATPVTTPQGITTDGTYLYITSGNSIQKVVTGGGATSTLIMGLNAPQGITTDGTNLYIANSGDHTIRTIPVAGSTLSTVAGAAGISGSTDATLGINARFNHPGGITTDGTNLYITDTGNQTIRKIQ